MLNTFKLTITEPSLIRRVGMMNTLLDIADRMTNEIRFSDNSYLTMSVCYRTDDSSYARPNGFNFPLCVTLRRQKDESDKTTIVARVKFALWERDDSHCMVMFNLSNSPENNLDSSYMETLDWIVEKVKALF